VGARFSAVIQTGSGAHPAFSTMGTGSFLGIKRPGRGNHPPPSSTKVKERVELYLYSPSGPLWPVQGELYLYLTLRVHLQIKHLWIPSRTQKVTHVFDLAGCKKQVTATVT